MRQPLNILLVEDQKQDAELILEILRAAGFQFTSVCVETEEDYRQHLTQKPDIILSDYTLPQFDGLKSLEILRKEKEWDTPFILVSGKIGEEAAVKAMKLGANDYLMKDNLNRLPETIKRELNEASIRLKLQETQDQYQKLVNYSPDAVLIRNNSDVIVFSNPAGCNLLRAKNIEELIGKSIFDIVHPNFHALVEERSKEMNKTGLPVPMIEEKFIRLDGSAIDVEVSAAPILFNNIPSVQMLIRDISTRKQGETKIKRQYARLKKLLSRVKELRSADLMKSEFLANMSHELRTPLNAIIGFSEMLKDGMIGNLTPKQKNYCEDIYKSGHHLLSLINEILDLSKIEAGVMQFEPEMTNLPTLLKDCLRVVQSKVKTNNLECSLTIDPKIDQVVVDSKKIRQIVYNLLHNAVKFTMQGEIKLIAELELDNILKISVQDSGVGISPENLKKLFKPFAQIPEAQFKQQEGTGLGLVMIKRLAEIHSGSVHVESEPGKGSCFSVKIPYITSSLKEETYPSIPLSPVIPNGKPTVLVIEDDAQAFEIMSFQINQLDMQVQQAKSAEEGLEIMNQQHIDLIVLDIFLPGMNGWEMLSHLKQDPQLKNIPVFIVSVAADEKKGMALGAIEVLQKPIGRFELINALQKYIKADEGTRKFTVMTIDDDPNVLTMMETYLKNTSYTLIGASNKVEAERHLKNTFPDLIILDLIMPEMNGFEVIDRLKKDPKTMEIPVVVLTSKSITEEDKRKLETNVVKILAKNNLSESQFKNEIARVFKH